MFKRLANLVYRDDKATREVHIDSAGGCDADGLTTAQRALRVTEEEQVKRRQELADKKDGILNKVYSDRDAHCIQEALEVHGLVYPYASLDPLFQRGFADKVERALAMRSFIYVKDRNCDCFDAVLYSLRFIEDRFGLDFKHREFLDCMGFGGAACFYASCFGFRSVRGAEISRAGFEYALAAKDSIYGRPHIRPAMHVKFGHGSFQDYFSGDADVVFIDCGLACAHSVLDEGTLLSAVFSLCASLAPGSFLLVVAASIQLQTADCSAMGFPFLLLVHHADLMTGASENPQVDASSCSRNIWILKTARIAL